jgi:thiamine phosphate synthase YjbQ (UPF0047 family)
MNGVARGLGNVGDVVTPADDVVLETDGAMPAVSGRPAAVAAGHPGTVAPGLQPRRHRLFEVDDVVPAARGLNVTRAGREPRLELEGEPRLAWTAAHETLTLRTADEVEFIDLTDAVLDLVVRHRLVSGFVNVQTRHTTTAIVLNEAEPLLVDDFRRTLERVAPRLFGYAHDDFRRRRHVAPGERVNGHAHCRAPVGA